VSEQAMDLRSTAALLRRRSRVVAAAALLGLAAGIAYVVVEPPRLSSTTLVLLPTPTISQGSEGDVSTQVRIALSTTVLSKAGQAVKPSLSVHSVERRVEASAPTNQLIKIRAFSTRGSEAQALSQAVADSYVAYARDIALAVGSAALADLHKRETDLQGQIAALQGEIDATIKRQQAVDAGSTEGNREAQLLAGLRTEQADISLQLDKVKDQIATSAPVESVASAGTSVIQAASSATGSSTLHRLSIWAPLGAVVGAVVALVMLLVTARGDSRMGLRDEIADAVGSPVLAAVRSRPQKTVAGWSRLLEAYEATPVESWAFRQVLRSLVPVGASNRDHEAEVRQTRTVDHPRSLTVVSLSGDARGLALGPQMAVFASSLGIVTRLVTAGSHERAAALWAACAADRDSAPRPGLLIGDPGDDEAIDLTVVLVVADRREPSLSDAPSTTATVLAVAAATATEQELARVAVAVDDAGQRIDGIVMADPDPSDRTTGRHTLDERTRRVALPMRLTGVGSVDVPAADPLRGR